MVAETARNDRNGAGRDRGWQRLRHSAGRWPGRWLARPFTIVLGGLGRVTTSSLTRRIVILNLAALVALVAGILYLNKFRSGLIDTRVESLLSQGQIIAAAIAAQATVETDAITIDPDKLLDMQAGESRSPFSIGESAADFPINPEQVAPLLRRLISPTRTRARIYDQDGRLIVDSRGLYSRGQILRYDLSPPGRKNVFARWWETIRLWYRSGDMPVYKEVGSANGRDYPEVESALNGSPASVVRVGGDGGLIVSVAVPVQRFRGVLGSLLLSTESGDIDAIVQAERLAIMRVFLVAAVPTVLLSILLASTIAGPVRRLAMAAERVRRGVNRRVSIPDFGSRNDEIGHLSRALGDMTGALYKRMEAIETFAADVAHELKNPLTSLRSAVETMPLARTDEQRERLLAVIQHDVRRLDRLITDISDASRLDAELAREDTEPVDLGRLLETVVEIRRETGAPGSDRITLELEPGKFGRDAFFLLGHDSRLGQVFNNLIDNGLSFSPPDGSLRVHAVREPLRIVVTIDDDGPGIRAENLETIFERFYTDRPGAADFGQNSGLGLAITRQIVEAHRGTIEAQNRTGADGSIAGARFIVSLPTGVFDKR